MKLSVNNLTFTFPAGKQLFNKLSFTLEEYGLYFLTGQNGTGKTTLAHILAGLVESPGLLSGTITVQNSIHNLAHKRTKQFLYNHAVYVHQQVDNMLALNFSAKENICASSFPAYPGLSLATSTPNIPFGIPDNMPAKNLSGGQRQLLTLSMALAKNPLILILDEPTSALDQANARHVMDMIKHISKDIFCICICHDDAIIQDYQTGEPIKLG